MMGYALLAESKFGFREGHIDRRVWNTNVV